MKCVKNGPGKKRKKGGVDYGGATSACDNKRAVRKAEKDMRREGSASKGLVNEGNKRKKSSLNTGSSKRTLDRGRIVKKKKQGFVAKIREKVETKRKNKKRNLGRYVSPRYM